MTLMAVLVLFLALALTPTILAFNRVIELKGDDLLHLTDTTCIGGAIFNLTENEDIMIYNHVVKPDVNSCNKNGRHDCSTKVKQNFASMLGANLNLSRTVPKLGQSLGSKACEIAGKQVVKSDNVFVHLLHVLYCDGENYSIFDQPKSQLCCDHTAKHIPCIYSTNPH